MKSINRNSNQLYFNELIHQIVYLIKNRNNYLEASRILLENNISINELSEKTIKLTDLDLAKLADALIENRN